MLFEKLNIILVVDTFDTFDTFVEISNEWIRFFFSHFLLLFSSLLLPNNGNGSTADANYKLNSCVIGYTEKLVVTAYSLHSSYTHKMVFNGSMYFNNNNLEL